MSDIQLINEAPRHLVGIRRKVPVKELQGYFSEVLPKVMTWMKENGVAPATPPMAMWCAMDRETGVADTHAGCFVAESVDGDGEISAGTTPGGEALKLVHVGSYEKMGQSWQRVYAHAKELGRAPGAGWEIYVDDPQEVAPDALRTEIYLPLQSNGSK